MEPDPGCRFCGERIGPSEPQLAFADGAAAHVGCWDQELAAAKAARAADGGG